MIEENILIRLDKIEHQLKFFADAYSHLHNIFIRGVHINLEKELLQPTLSKVTDKLVELREIQKDFHDLVKNDGITGTLSFMAKQIYEMQSSIKDMKENGVKKKLHLDFTVDGYEMVKKSPVIKDDDLQEDINPEQAVMSLLESLTPKDAEVIKHRYGLLGEQQKTLSQLSKLMNLSRERLRQIQNKALRKMRHACRRKYVSVLTHKELRQDIIGE